MQITQKFRIKDSISRKKLKVLAGSVNFVWNYINDLSYKNIKNNGRFLSNYTIDSYTSGSSKELPLHSTTFQAISKVYVVARKEAHKRKLAWRSAKRSTGWIPFKASAIKIADDTATYCGQSFKFYKSRDVLGIIKSGSFNQDYRGRWFINLVIEIDESSTKLKSFPNKEVGIDLGIKDKLVLSDGTKYYRENLTKKYEEKLASAQRAGKTRLVANINAKIKNSRLDWNHKITTEICRNYQKIIAGNIQISDLIEQGFKDTRKALLDSSLSTLKCFFNYKAQKLGNTFKLVNEAYTTMRCSQCGALTGPHGSEGLSIREWGCGSCHALHDRDTNSAINILRLGH